LLFLGAGSVIIAMHHEQDMRKMGGLRKYMPITWATSLIGSLALIGTPLFSGFYSKDSIIDAVHHSNIAGSTYAYWAVLIGVFFTALYSFRMYFMVFHGKERMDEHTREHLHETPWVVTVPLIALAIPSIGIAWFTFGDMMSGKFFGEAIFVLPQHNTLANMASYDVWGLTTHAFMTAPFWLALAGVVVAWAFYMKWTHVPDLFMNKLKVVYDLLVQKYFMDHLYIKFISPLGVLLGNFLWQVGDVKIIDGAMVNGSANTVGVISSVLRKIQTGYLYTYAIWMIVGLIVLVAAFVLGWIKI
jgi:NADH-quinone oxidoreductase subunit L